MTVGLGPQALDTIPWGVVENHTFCTELLRRAGLFVVCTILCESENNSKPGVARRIDGVVPPWASKAIGYEYERRLFRVSRSE